MKNEDLCFRNATAKQKYLTIKKTQLTKMEVGIRFWTPNLSLSQKCE